MTIKNPNEIKAWLGDYLAQTLKVARAQVDGDKAFDRFGMDSVAVVAMTGDVSEWLGVEISPTLAYDHPTINTFSEAIAALLAQVEVAA